MIRQLKHTKQKITLRIAAGLVCFALSSEVAVAASFTLNYSGRLTRSDGSPVEGPVAIQVKFWNSSTDGAQIGQSLEYPGINLSAGVFALELVFSADQVAAVFGDGTSPVYIEITSENKTYPRQQFSYVPFALRVPVDSKTLAFDADGKLSLSLTSKPGANQFLTKDSDGKLIWGTPAAPTIQNQAIATGTPSSGQVLTYNGSQWAASTPTSGGGGGSGVTGTLAVLNGGTGATTFTNNGVLIGAGNLPISTATGSQYQVFTSGAGGTLGFGAVNLGQGAAVSGVLPAANGGTGVNSTATFPTAGVLVTRDAVETITNKTITTATINGSSTISGSTEINTTGTIASGAATVSGNVTIKGDGTTARKLILNDKGSTNSVSIKAPDTLASSLIFELPSTNGANGQVLATNGSGTLSWTSGVTPTGTAGGDLTGSYPNPTLTNVGTAGAYFKVVVDSKGRVTSGTSLTAADIPNLSASQITSGTLNLAQLPTAGTAGTFAKVTTDAYGRVAAGTTLSSTDVPPISASLITSGTLNTAQLPTAGTAGTYAKVTTDAYGRVTAGTTLATSDITSSLGFTPINKAGDTISGALNLGSNDVLSAGNIQMAESKTLALSGNTADPTGLVSTDKGKTWFNSTTNQIKYWDGSSAVALGVSGSGLSSFNGQTGNTQTLATPGTTGTAPAWSSNANAHTLNIPLASTAGVTAGLISNADYNTFNGKVAGVTSGTGVSVSTTGNIATVNLATSGSAGTYAKVTTDTYGRVSNGTTLSSTDIPPISAALITSGTLSVANGGTGLTSTPTNGQVLIGNGTNYSLSTLTAGSGVSISNASGAITISTSGVGSVTSVNSGAGLTGGPITSTGTLSLATIGTAGTYAKVTTDAYGRVSAGTTLSSTDIPPISAALITSGTLNIAQLPTIGTAGTYAKVTTDSYGRVTAGTTLASSDITSSLGFTPINKAGDTISGALNLGSNDVLSAGNIQMAASKTLALSGNTADPTGLVSTDKGKTWFNTTSNQIKYWDGSSTQTLGAVGASVSSLNGQTGSTQTFAVPGTTGTAPTWSSAANAHTLNIPLASTASVTAGLISNSDYNTFNGKVAGVTSGTGVTVSTTGNIATVNLSTTGTSGTYSKVTTDAYGRVSVGTTLSSSDIPPISASLITSGTLNTAQLPTAGTAGTYAKVTTDTYGRVSSGTTLVATDLPPHSAALISSGTLSVANGGTGLTSTPTNGQVLIGNGTNYSLSTLSAGAGVSITNTAGGITVAATADASTKVSKTGDTMTGALTVPLNGLIAGTSQLVLANGNVGIGTTAPTDKLYIVSSAGGSGLTIDNANSPSLGFAVGGVLKAQLGVAASDNSWLTGSLTNDLVIRSNVGAKVMFGTNAGGASTMVLSGSYVGIGTTTPSQPLHVLSSSYLPLMLDKNSSLDRKVGLLLAHQGTWDWEIGNDLNATNSQLLYIYDDRASATRMVINSNGNVGIGTTTPATALDVQGQIRSLVYNAAAGTTFDWNNGNTQYTTATCGAFTFSNMKDGGIYTLIVKSTTQGTCAFTQAGLTFRSQTSLTTASGTYTIFNILVAGTDAFVTIRRGF